MSTPTRTGFLLRQGGAGLRAGLAVLLALVLLTAAARLPALRDSPHGTAVAVGVEIAAYASAALLIFARVLLVARHRTAWALLGLGVSGYSAGNLVYFATAQDAATRSFPATSDLLWLSFYPLAYCCLLLLLRARVVRWHASTWLDGLVAGGGLGAVSAALLLESTAGSSGTAEVSGALSYVAGDLLLAVLLLLGLAMTGWRDAGVWRLLCGGLVCFVAGDLVFLADTAAGQEYTSGGWVDLTWLSGVALMAVAAWTGDDAPPAERMDGWALLAVPLTCAVSSVGLLVASSLQPTGAHSVVVWLAAATILLALTRTALTFHEVRSLSEARLQARTDDLTGLPNRRAFLEELADTASRTDTAFAVLLIDLDRFKEVNDSLGHLVGDELLRLVGPRLSQTLNRGGTLARMGGDEFGVLLPGADSTAARRVASEMSVALRETFVLDGLPVHIEASIGIAVSGLHGRTPTLLLQSADLAMYAAKRGRLGHAVHSADAVSDARTRLQTLEELRHALETDQLVPHYQPKLDLRTGRVTGAEALVRWEHPERGLVPPDAFLPLAERAGLMRRLTLRVLEQSLRDLRAWRAEGHDLHVAVNLSVSNLQDVGLPSQVQLLLDSLQVPAGSLVLEITEDVLMSDAERSQQVLAGLRALGVRLAVDDYGTGYSSLTYLRALPVDELKLDRSFVTHLLTDPRAAAIARSTVALSHELGMTMVAEGVEDADVLATLAAWDCDLAQGYHIARPQSAGRFSEWLAAADLPRPRRPLDDTTTPAGARAQSRPTA